jgi:hypothetical protein
MRERERPRCFNRRVCTDATLECAGNPLRDSCRLRGIAVRYKAASKGRQALYWRVTPYFHSSQDRAEWWQEDLH